DGKRVNRRTCLVRLASSEYLRLLVGSVIRAMRLSDLTIIVGLKYIVLKSSTIIKTKYALPVGSPLEQRVNAQLLVEEGNGKPPHHHRSSHFPSLDVTSVPPLVSSGPALRQSTYHHQWENSTS